MSSAETYANRWWIAATVMIVAVIEILDSTIVNVSLPHMMGALGANIDQITWVLTSYIVAAAIFMPLTGFLVKTLGQRQLLLINIVGFVIASMLCGISVNLVEIIVFRIFQGIFGASLVPLSQFILRDTFPKKEQGTAMAIWGVGVMSAPVLGPTVGGLITEYLSWRWIFYINLPVCTIAYFMTFKFIEHTPTERSTVDWYGLIFMAIGIGCFQTFLDRGNNVNWFDASSTLFLTLAFSIALPLFVWRCLSYHSPIINLNVFRDRNFVLSTILLSAYVMFIFGQIILSPLQLQNLMNYPSLTAGLAMAPRGVASMIAMALSARLLKKFDARLLIFGGLLVSLYGTYIFAKFNLSISFEHYVFASLFQGFGMGLFFVPLSTVALSTLPHTQLADGSGLWGLSRNLGQSLGISIMATILSRMTQKNWNVLGGYINNFNINLTWWEQSANRPWDSLTAQILGQQLQNHAQMIAFNDVAWLATLGLVLLLPLVFLIRPLQLDQLTDDIGLH